MKTKFLFSTILSFGLCAGIAQAQQWTFGPKAYQGLTSGRTTNSQTQINGINVTTNDYGDAIGSALGVFARYDRLRWYAQFEAARGKYSSANVDVNGPGGTSVLYPSAARTDARLLVGVKPLPWLRLSAGVVGVRNNWNRFDYEAESRSYEVLGQRYPNQRDYYQRQADLARIAGAAQSSLKRTMTEGQVGIGVDIGGLTLDLTHNIGVTPVLDGIQFQQQQYAIQQRYNYWALNVGYRLFPLKAHLLAPRKRNPAYKRIKQDVPFYRNEFHASVGVLGEDIGSAFIYENRYTRYFTRRVGLATGVNMMRVHQNLETDSPIRLYSSFMLTTGIRLLPLYSRRHTVGLTTGPTLTHQVGVGLIRSSKPLNVNGQPVYVTDLRSYSRYRGWDLGWQSSIDYQFAVTDRMLVGPWLRLSGEDFIIPDFASTGLQVGYRF